MQEHNGDHAQAERQQFAVAIALANIPVLLMVKLFFDVEGPKLRPDRSTMRQMPTLLLLHGGPGFDHSGFKPAFAEMAAMRPGLARLARFANAGHGVYRDRPEAFFHELRDFIAT
ncbi:MAG TPA: alpha/beta hydrolase [Candidatus Binataceae bacterium]|nr:alpha/beta hydrolase [Candidatus Binataceae bacterium]